MKNIESNLALLIGPTATIREALKQIDINQEGALFVVDERRFLLGVLTDGDIRRAIIRGKQLTETINTLYNTQPYSVLKKEFDLAVIRKVLVEKRYDVIPILEIDGVIIGYETWAELLGGDENQSHERVIEVPVVIMAGGKGTRMAPFTTVLPKPLIPIGEKTILELIIDQFGRFGVKDYYITINYRGEMIKAYFDCIERDYSIEYIKESDFFGTAGSLKLLPQNLGDTFIVSNCDIIVKADFAEVLDFHRATKAALTVLSSIQHHTVPYGVIKFEQGGRVLEIEEKPEFSFCINTGVYILNRECLSYIPDGKVFHMTDLMAALMSDGKQVVTYPINEREYIDIGQWEEYQKAIILLKGQ